MGFGDYYPVNHESRFFCILAAIGGVIFTATLIELLHSNLSLTDNEQIMLTYLSENENEKSRINLASRLISSSFRLFLIRKRERFFNLAIDARSQN